MLHSTGFYKLFFMMPEVERNWCQMIMNSKEGT